MARPFTVQSALGRFTLTVDEEPVLVSDAMVAVMAVSARDVDDYWTGRLMRDSYQRRYQKLRAQYGVL